MQCKSCEELISLAQSLVSLYPLRDCDTPMIAQFRNANYIVLHPVPDNGDREYMTDYGFIIRLIRWNIVELDCTNMEKWDCDDRIIPVLRFASNPQYKPNTSLHTIRIGKVSIPQHVLRELSPSVQIIHDSWALKSHHGDF